MNYHYLISLLVVGGIAAALLLLRKLLFRFLHQVSKKTESQIDDLLIAGLEAPSTILIIALALYISIRLAELPEAYMAYATRGMYLSLILTVTMGIANISGHLLAYFLKKADLPISVTGLLNAVAKALVYAIGILMMLNALGVSITPIITALGVGGLAMALALQDTLSNLFAGIHILAEHTIRVNDFIRLENGQEGLVLDIGWRTTRIRMQQNNIIIIPNSKLSQSVVTNYCLPERRMAITLSVGVSYDEDPDAVERVLIDEAKKAVGEVSGLLAEPAPIVRFLPGFGPSSLDFTLICHVSDALDQMPVQHELNKRIFRRFKLEGIEIPFPTRTVYVREAAPKKSE
ncbi:MAG TPA: mechanosensitive ion channel family protein [Nitrospirota bacterium]